MGKNKQVKVDGFKNEPILPHKSLGRFMKETLQMSLQWSQADRTDYVAKCEKKGWVVIGPLFDRFMVATDHRRNTLFDILEALDNEVQVKENVNAWLVQELIHEDSEGLHQNQSHTCVLEHDVQHSRSIYQLASCLLEISDGLNLRKDVIRYNELQEVMETSIKEDFSILHGAVRKRQVRFEDLDAPATIQATLDSQLGIEPRGEFKHRIEH